MRTHRNRSSEASHGTNLIKLNMGLERFSPGYEELDSWEPEPDEARLVSGVDSSGPRPTVTRVEANHLTGAATDYKGQNQRPDRRVVIVEGPIQPLPLRVKVIDVEPEKAKVRVIETNAGKQDLDGAESQRKEVWDPDIERKSFFRRLANGPN